ncbi:MAG: hypothetical protein IJJ41_01385 [Clostridia bacterium]|nr:hypothetical protein [Clostridia bacterium]MBR0413717.1 hypothetical protein [Clostridia bacterium]
MKKYVLVILVVLVASLTACAVKASTNPSDPQTEVSITSEETSELVTDTTKKESVKETTQTTSKKQKKSASKKATTEKKETTKSQTTTKEATTTHKQPTTQKPTEKKTTTTKKQTTTKRQQTTKAPTTKPQTTKPKTCTNNYNHSLSCGNMGRWFSSRSEVRAYVNAEMNKWNSLFESGTIGENEYFRNCPSGYECWSCSNCGRWTGNFTY